MEKNALGVDVPIPVLPLDAIRKLELVDDPTLNRLVLPTPLIERSAEGVVVAPIPTLPVLATIIRKAVDDPMENKF